MTTEPVRCWVGMPLFPALGWKAAASDSMHIHDWECMISKLSPGLVQTSCFPALGIGLPGATHLCRWPPVWHPEDILNHKQTAEVLAGLLRLPLSTLCTSIAALLQASAVLSSTAWPHKDTQHTAASIQVFAQVFGGGPPLSNLCWGWGAGQKEVKVACDLNTG